MIHIYIYTYIHIQGDNSLLTKRKEKVLKYEQSVCSQDIINQLQKLRAREASEEKINTNNVWNNNR